MSALQAEFELAKSQLDALPKDTFSPELRAAYARYVKAGQQLFLARMAPSRYR